MFACLHAKSLQSCPTLCNTTDSSSPGSSYMGFSKQEYWNGFPCPPPGYLLDPGIKPMSLMSPELAAGFFTTEAPGKTTQMFVETLFVIPQLGNNQDVLQINRIVKLENEVFCC